MMNNNSLFLNLISIFIIFSTIFVVISSNAIYSLFFLVLSFIFFSFILIILECEFLALIIIIIYVGAISVLFLFLIMMVDLKIKNNYKYFLLYKLSGVIVVIMIYFVLLDQIMLNGGSIFYGEYYASNYYINWINIKTSIYEIESYSTILYSLYVLQFLLVGFILLVVLIGSVYFINFPLKLGKCQLTVKQISCNSLFF
jgi:NADH:ubiquinone oxidoreductase subunit 6 (subunit J)